MVNRGPINRRQLLHPPAKAPIMADNRGSFAPRNHR